MIEDDLDQMIQHLLSGEERKPGGLNLMALNQVLSLLQTAPTTRFTVFHLLRSMVQHVLNSPPINPANDKSKDSSKNRLVDNDPILTLVVFLETNILNGPYGRDWSHDITEWSLSVIVDHESRNQRNNPSNEKRRNRDVSLDESIESRMTNKGLVLLIRLFLLSVDKLVDREPLSVMKGLVQRIHLRDQVMETDWLIGLISNRHPRPLLTILLHDLMHRIRENHADIRASLVENQTLRVDKMGIMSDLQILENISMKNPDVAAEAILHHVREQKRVLDVFALFVLSSKIFKIVGPQVMSAIEDNTDEVIRFVCEKGEEEEIYFWVEKLIYLRMGDLYRKFPTQLRNVIRKISSSATEMSLGKKISERIQDIICSGIFREIYPSPDDKSARNSHTLNLLSDDVLSHPQQLHENAEDLIYIEGIALLTDERTAAEHFYFVMRETDDADLLDHLFVTFYNRYASRFSRNLLEKVLNESRGNPSEVKRLLDCGRRNVRLQRDMSQFWSQLFHLYALHPSDDLYEFLSSHDISQDILPQAGSLIDAALDLFIEAVAQQKATVEEAKVLVIKISTSFPDTFSVVLDTLLDYCYSREAGGVLKPANAHGQNAANQPLGVWSRPFPKGEFARSTTSQKMEEGDILYTSLLDSNRNKFGGKKTDFPLRIVTSPPTKRPRVEERRAEMVLSTTREAQGRHHITNLIERLSSWRSSHPITGVRTASSASIITSHLLLRVKSLTETDPLPEQYNEHLPRKAGFGRDLYIEKSFQQNPILWDLLEMLAGRDLMEFSKTVEVVRSLLSTSIAGLHAERPLHDTQQDETAHSAIRLLHMLDMGEWLPAPLNRVADVLPLLPHRAKSEVLLVIFNWLKDFPPFSSSFEMRDNVYRRNLPPDVPIYRYVSAVKDVLRNNMTKVAPYYSLFQTI